MPRRAAGRSRPHVQLPAASASARHRGRSRSPNRTLLSRRKPDADTGEDDPRYYRNTRSLFSFDSAGIRRRVERGQRITPQVLLDEGVKHEREAGATNLFSFSAAHYRLVSGGGTVRYVRQMVINSGEAVRWGARDEFGAEPVRRSRARSRPALSAVALECARLERLRAAQERHVQAIDEAAGGGGVFLPPRAALVALYGLGQVVQAARVTALFQRKRADRAVVECVVGSDATETAPVVVFYGNGSFSRAMRAARSPPASDRRILRLLQRDRRCIVFVTSEYRTSSVCPVCLYGVSDLPGGPRQPRSQRPYTIANKTREEAAAEKAAEEKAAAAEGRKPRRRCATTRHVHRCRNPECDVEYIDHDELGAWNIALAGASEMLHALMHTFPRDPRHAAAEYKWPERKYRKRPPALAQSVDEASRVLGVCRTTVQSATSTEPKRR